ncbi:glycosyltransferase family 4 protein [Aurantiacibacter flavus]|uniref:Glycosyltransferase family 4 protein n=1 Tax=Aurantiacibacter flavus TaxID=3145232 RepID=A0ABV0CZS4_9SPHN
MTNDEIHTQACGLAKAAMHLAAKGKMSALDLSRQAVELASDSFTLSAHCRVALQLYDTDALENAVRLMEAQSEECPALHSLVCDMRSGPLAAVELARQLSVRGPADMEPVPGRILYVLDKSLPQATDGYATRSHGIVRALLQKGVDLVCVTRPGFPYDLHQDSNVSEAADLVEVVDGVKYHRLAWPRRSCFPAMPMESMAYGSLAYLRQSTKRLAEAIARHRPACVVAASNMATALPACLAAHGSGLPFVYEVRGFWEITRASRDPQYLLTPTGRQERYLEVATALAAEAVVTLTGAMRNELVLRGVPEQRIVLAPNASDPHRFSPIPRDPALMQQLRLHEDMPVIGYVGTFNPYEGLDDLVRACAGLRQEGLEFRLVLVGSGPEKVDGHCVVTEQLLELADKLGLGEWVIMPGRVLYEDAVRWYSLIDIAAFPRKPKSVTEFVSPLKPLEALAMEKAVVVSSVGGMREMVEDGRTGLVFPKGDPSALGAALRKLLKNEKLRQNLGKKGRAWIQQERSWRDAANEMLNALEPVM